MCIICELKKMVKEVADEVMGAEMAVVTVGTVGAGTMTKFKEFGRQKALLEISLKEAVAKEERQAIEEGTMRLTREQKAKLQKQEDEANEQLEALHTKAWEAVYSELNLDPSGMYMIDHDTGEVTQRVPKGEEPEAPVADGVH